MINLKWLVLVICALFFNTEIMAQSYAFGLKGGPSLNSQTWSADGKRGLLPAYFGDVFIESAGSDKFAFGASLGYHIRGSMQKFTGGYNMNTGKYFNPTRYPSKLGNLSALVYMKQYLPTQKPSTRYYYFFGGRLDYNVMKDLGRYSIFDPLVKNFTYGMTAGGGFDWSLGELWGGFVELSIAPDFSNQIYIPQSRGFENPNTGEQITVRDGAVINFSVELALGIRLMHLITYVD